MKDIAQTLVEYVKVELKNLASAIAPEAELGSVNILTETPPKPEMGDLAFPMFPFAKAFKCPPPKIAADLSVRLNESPDFSNTAEAKNFGPYLNVFLKKEMVISTTLKKVISLADKYGKSERMKGRKVMVEFSCPNTNKPLHLGHMRNDSLGESIAQLLKANGAEVKKVNLINDRGVHICKSMLAYKKFGEGRSPEDEGLKSDHFVGKYYVEYNNWAKSDKSAEAQAQEMLVQWESGNKEVRELWKKMNAWTIDGVKETYKKTGISFDTYYFESDTYVHGRSEVLKALEAGHFYKADDGSIWVDLEEIGLDKKVLLRSDGTSLYLTQDIGTAIARHGDWPFDELVYVVGSEQQYHFRVLFYVLGKIGYEWAKDLYHLSYGMVNLPEGKMKSREGTIVDADDLFDQLVEMAKKEIIEKERQGEVGNLDETAYAIALGALNYYLLQTTPTKDMIFNPAESISFNGNTGPYLQYMGARICSMLRKAEDMGLGKQSIPNIETLTADIEWELVKLIAKLETVVESAAIEHNPSLVTTYLFDLAKTFSRYYHDNPIVTHEDKNVAEARIFLAKAVRQVLENAFALVGIPFLEVM